MGNTPSRDEFVQAVKSNHVNEVTQILDKYFNNNSDDKDAIANQQKFLFERDDKNNTPLDYACLYSVSDEMVEIILSKMIINNEQDIVKANLLLPSPPTSYLNSRSTLSKVCLYGSVHKIKLVITKIVLAGGKSRLLEQLKTKDLYSDVLGNSYKKTPRHMLQSVRFFSALLFFIGSFKELYDQVVKNNNNKYKSLFANIGIHDSSWRPVPELLDEVKQMMEGKVLSTAAGNEDAEFQTLLKNFKEQARPDAEKKRAHEGKPNSSVNNKNHRDDDDVSPSSASGSGSGSEDENIPAHHHDDKKNVIGKKTLPSGAETQHHFEALKSAITSHNDTAARRILKKLTEGKYNLKAVLSMRSEEDNQTALMLVCSDESPSMANLEIAQILLAKIIRAGGTGFLREQLEATDDDGCDCLLLACELSTRHEIIPLLLDKIQEAGGATFLRKRLRATDKAGKTCLTALCSYCSSAEVVKLMMKKMIEVGSTDLLKSALSHEDARGNSLLALVCNYSPSPDVMKFVATMLFQFQLFKKQYEKLNARRNRLEEKAGIKDVNWSPDSASIAGVRRFIDNAVSAGTNTIHHSKVSSSSASSGSGSGSDSEGNITHSKNTTEAKKWKIAHDKMTEEQFKAQQQHQHQQQQQHKKKTEEKKEAVPVEKSKTEVTATAKSKSQDKNQNQKPGNHHHDSTTSISVSAPPPSRCFKRGVPDKNLEDAVHALFSIKDAPENRPDLKTCIPDKEDADDLLHYLKFAVKDLKKRSSVQKLIAENRLTDDDIKILHSYKIQNPYPVYRWLNGWLGGDRRDDFVKEHVAPFFTLLYRAMEKLPKIKSRANRSVIVHGIASLQHTFENFQTVCAKGENLSFWGFSSFSTADDVINREEFVGKPNEEAIIYTCGELEGVDMEPFAPQGLKSESEILPLCPSVFEVTSSVKMGQKLIVGVTQLDHTDFAYVAPK